MNRKTPSLIVVLGLLCSGLLSGPGLAERAQLTDVHIHYSHDAWDLLPPEEAVAVLREAGLKRAFVSSSSDDGTQMLHKADPALIVPVLRPYRRRGETGTWLHDESVIAHVEGRLEKHRYAGIGEFHVFGADADLPVMRRMVTLAQQYGIFLHAHSDAEAVERIFVQAPTARVLWAHSGFEEAGTVRRMLQKYETLSADLAFRTDHAPGGALDPEWRQLLVDFSDRFMIGTDTYTPERWYYVIDHATWSRGWLAGLPPAVAKRIATENAEALADWALQP